MQAAVLPFRYGWQWILDGAHLFAKQPMAMFFWSLVTNVLFILSYLIPLLGQALLIAAMPALTFVVLSAARNVSQNKIMRAGMWLKPLADSKIKRQFVRLGLAYLFACLAGGLVATLPFIPSIVAALENSQAIDEFALISALQWPLLAFFVVYIVISALFWHAPALIGWHGLQIRQALFYSIVACWRNKWPFLLYALSWAALFYAVHLFGTVLLGLGLADGLTQFILTLINLGLTALLYCTFYPIYHSTFGIEANA